MLPYALKKRHFGETGAPIGVFHERFPFLDVLLEFQVVCFARYRIFVHELFNFGMCIKHAQFDRLAKLFIFYLMRWGVIHNLSQCQRLQVFRDDIGFDRLTQIALYDDVELALVKIFTFSNEIFWVIETLPEAIV